MSFSTKVKSAYVFVYALAFCLGQFGCNSTASLQTSSTMNATNAPAPLGGGGGAPLGPMWFDIDVGDTGASGQSTISGVDPNMIFDVAGSGTGFDPNNGDSFHLTYRSVGANFTFVAQVISVDNTDGGAFGALIVRDSFDPTSTYASVGLQANGSSFFSSTNVQAGGNASSAPYWLKLVGAAGQITGFDSPDGVTWSQIGSDSMVVSDTAVLGFAVASNVQGTLAHAVFQNVSLEQN